MKQKYIVLLLCIFIGFPATTVFAGSVEEEISLDDLEGSSINLQSINPLRLPGKSYDDRARETIITGYAVTSYRFNDNGVEHHGQGNELHFGQDAANTSEFAFNVLEIGFTKRYSDYAWVAASFEVGVHREDSGTTTKTELDQGEIHLVAPVGNGIDFAFGKFNSPVSWEHEDAPLLLQATNSLHFQFGTPVKLTGLMVTYPFMENLEIRGAVFNGWDRNTGDTSDNNKFKSFLFQIGYAPKPWLDTKVSWLAGPEQNNNEDDFRQVVDFAATLTPWRNWIIGIEGSYGTEANQSTTDPGNAAEWFSGQTTVHYDWARWFGTTVRYSFFDDRDGHPDFEVPAKRTQHEITFAPTFHISPEYLGYMGFGVIPKTRHLLSGIDLRLEYRYDWFNARSAGFFKDNRGAAQDYRNTFIAEIVASF